MRVLIEHFKTFLEHLETHGKPRLTRSYRGMIASLQSFNCRMGISSGCRFLCFVSTTRRSNELLSSILVRLLIERRSLDGPS